MAEYAAALVLLLASAGAAAAGDTRRPGEIALTGAAGDLVGLPLGSDVSAIRLPIGSSLPVLGPPVGSGIPAAGLPVAPDLVAAGLPVGVDFRAIGPGIGLRSGIWLGIRQPETSPCPDSRRIALAGFGAALPATSESWPAAWSERPLPWPTGCRTGD